MTIDKAIDELSVLLERMTDRKRQMRLGMIYINDIDYRAVDKAIIVLDWVQKMMADLEIGEEKTDE